MTRSGDIVSSMVCVMPRRSPPPSATTGPVSLPTKRTCAPWNTRKHLPWADGVETRDARVEKDCYPKRTAFVHF
jgi:hypothetical protein